MGEVPFSLCPLYIEQLGVCVEFCQPFDVVSEYVFGGGGQRRGEICGFYFNFAVEYILFVLLDELLLFLAKTDFAEHFEKNYASFHEQS